MVNNEVIFAMVEVVSEELDLTATGCLGLVVIVLIAVQTLSAALANPMKGLRVE